MRGVLDSGPIIYLSWIDHLDLLDTLFEDLLRQNGFWISAKLAETIQHEESEAET